MVDQGEGAAGRAVARARQLLEVRGLVAEHAFAPVAGHRQREQVDLSGALGRHRRQALVDQFAVAGPFHGLAGRFRLRGGRGLPGHAGEQGRRQQEEQGEAGRQDRVRPSRPAQCGRGRPRRHQSTTTPSNPVTRGWPPVAAPVRGSG